MRTSILVLIGFAGGLWAEVLEPPVMALYAASDQSEREVAWSTRPGARYVLQECSNLASNDWVTVAGYPSEAAALAQQQLVELDAINRFYRVAALDEQPPDIEIRIPDDGDFGVRRFSAVQVELADNSDVDGSFISVLLGTNDTYTTASTELSWSNNVLTLDLGGDTALGGYGETQTIALAVSDVLGNATNYTWSFELERQITTASNAFVFGSPDAQRAGQQLRGAPAVLAARMNGPIRMSGSMDEWEISSVSSNEIVLAYTNIAPTFFIGQVLANLAPAHVDEIFYRRVDGVVDDTTNSLLRLQTTEVTLPEILTDGSFTLSEDVVSLEFDENGNLVQAVDFNRSFSLPTIGDDFSGNSLYESGPLSLVLDEGRFLYTSQVRASLETSYLSVNRFAISASGNLDIACVPNLTLSSAYSTSLDKNLWTATKWLTFTAGVVPVFVKVQASVTANASVDLDASAGLRTGFRQTASMEVKGAYVKNTTPSVMLNRNFDVAPFETVPLTCTLNGSGSVSIALVPQIDILIYGAAGLYINTDPRLQLSGSATMVDEVLTAADFQYGSSADINCGLTIRGVDNDEFPSVDFNLFSKTWPYQFPDGTKPLSVAVQPVPLCVQEGDEVLFFVEAQGGSGEYGYQWRFDGVKIPGQNESELRLQDVDEDYVGDYSVRITSGAQTVDSDPAVLYITTDGNTGPFPIDANCVSSEIINARWVKNTYSNGNVTMSDRTSNKMWIWYANQGRTRWADASSYCANLTYAGYSDWELPNREDLVGQVGQLGHFYKAEPFAYYWTGETSGTSAWTVYMSNGTVVSFAKTAWCYIWPVRTIK